MSRAIFWMQIYSCLVMTILLVSNFLTPLPPTSFTMFSSVLGNLRLRIVTLPGRDRCSIKLILD